MNRYTFDVCVHRDGAKIEAVLILDAKTEELTRMKASNLLAYPTKMDLINVS